MVRLVAVAQALEDLDGLIGRRLVDRNRLEAALKRRVLLDVLAVFVERGRADDLDIAARQGGLQDIGRVDRALGCAGADDHVQLIDEQDDVLVLLQLLEHALDALLELAAVLGAGDHAGQVQGDELLVLEVIRHVARRDLLGQALCDGRLANARVADERRVILGAAGQDLDDAVDLLLAADDRVKLALAGGLCQVLAVLGQRLASAAGSRRLGRAVCAGLAGRALALAHVLRKLVEQRARVDTQVIEDGDGHVLALMQQAEQQVLGADVAVAHLGRRRDGQLDDALGARRQPLRGRRVRRAEADQLLDLLFNIFCRDTGLGQDLGRHAAALEQQAVEQMLGADIVMTHAAGRLLCELDRGRRTVGESIVKSHKATLLSVERSFK